MTYIRADRCRWCDGRGYRLPQAFNPGIELRSPCYMCKGTGIDPEPAWREAALAVERSQKGDWAEIPVA
jgi:hypothetical protein